MALELKMPALSPTMEKGTLARWLVGEGDLVRPGDLIAEIETDKATMEFEAVDGGRVSKLLVAEGTDDVPVGTVIMVLAGDDEEVAPAPQPVAAVPTLEPVAAVPMLEPVAAVPALEPKILLSEPMVEAARTNATPLARRIASIRGIALPTAGSGPRGRVVKADLGLPPRMSVAVQASAAPLVAFMPPPPGVPVETVKLSTMRKTIARRLTESKASVPHFYLTVRCNLDQLLALRTQLNAGLAARGIKLSVNDMLLKAMALALVEVPDANVQFGGDELHRFGRVDLSMAVAIDGGLVTPVIRDVGGLSLSAIAQTSRSLAERAREGKLAPEDYQGGTASISNLGMFGIDEMVPVINPPQAVILGIGAAVEQPWKVDGAIGLATIMSATASFDHRAIDGAVASRFIAAFRNLVETPWSICC